MKTCAIVCEYNPFHRGHKYQIEKLKNEYGISHLVGIMSGNFTQRGNPAILDKFIRAKMALMEGMDLIIEIPVIFSVSSAEFFSHGAVSIMEKLGGIDYISFGAENPDLKKLNEISTLLINESQNYKAKLKENLKLGASFPSSRLKAIKSLGFENYSEILKSPNNILAIEYLKALKNLKSNIKIIPIKREGLGYHDEVLNDQLPSASSIRAFLEGLYNGEKDIKVTESLLIDRLNNYIPEGALGILIENIENMNKEDIVNKRLKDLINYRLQMDPNILYKLKEGKDGLGDRIYKKLASINTLTYEEFIEEIATKRFPKSRIRRLLLHVALHFDILNYEMDRKREIEEARILGLNKRGMEILKKVRKDKELILLDTLAKAKSSLMEYDKRANLLYSLLNMNYRASYDYTKNPIIME